MKANTIKFGLLLTAGMALAPANATDISTFARGREPACLKTEITQVKDATCEAGDTINDGACALESWPVASRGSIASWSAMATMAP
jgi:hypothetical protein